MSWGPFRYRCVPLGQKEKESAMRVFMVFTWIKLPSGAWLQMITSEFNHGVTCSWGMRNDDVEMLAFRRNIERLLYFQNRSVMITPKIIGKNQFWMNSIRYQHGNTLWVKTEEARSLPTMVLIQFPRKMSQFSTGWCSKLHCQVISHNKDFIRENDCHIPVDFNNRYSRIVTNGDFSIAYHESNS